MNDVDWHSLLKNQQVVEMDNPDFGLLVSIADDIHRLAEHFAPKESEGSQYHWAQMAGTISGAASALEDVMDSGNDLFSQKTHLRELVARWRGIAEEYSRKQAQEDQERVAKQQLH